MRRLIALAALASVARAATTVSATDATLRWSGRVEKRADGSVAFDCEGARIDVIVSGATSVSIRVNSTFLMQAPVSHADIAGGAGLGDGAARSLQDSSFPKFGVFRALVDGARVFEGQDGVVVLPGEGDFVVVAGLDASVPHNVSIVYTTDSVYNTWPDVNCPGCEMRVLSVTTDGAFSLAAERSRRMLIFGDSITAANQVSKPCDNATDNDFTRSYAFLLCEAFAANCSAVAVSSKGLMRNCCDSLPVTVPVFATRTLMQDPASVFDYASEPPPDAVLINLGTNDGDGNAAWEAAFVATYVSFMRNITRWTAKSDIVFLCAVGAITDRPLPLVERAMAAAPELKTVLVNMMGATLDGCGHPGVVGQPQMAAIAQPILAKALGWTPSAL
jgi:lysophospholipase L1-like esterase